MHIGEAEISALEAVGEAFVIEAELMQNCRVQVMHVDGAVGDFVAEIVARAVNFSGFEASSGSPHRKCVDVVVASSGPAVADFAHGSAAEFSTPDDDGVFEESALFQVENKGGGGLVDLFADLWEMFVEVLGGAAVMVPVRVIELYKADPALDEATGEETVVGVAVPAFCRAVEIEGGLALA